MSDFEFWQMQQPSARLKELDGIQDDLAKEKEANKIFRSRTLVENSSRYNIVLNIRDADNDEMLENVNDVYNYILRYNIQNMSKSVPDDEELTSS